MSQLMSKSVIDVLLLLMVKEVEVDKEWERNQRGEVDFETKRARTVIKLTERFKNVPRP